MAAGEHLFYYRLGSLYSHHGICCGDGSVVHYESSIWMKCVAAARGPQTPTIRRVSFDTFAQGHEVTVRQYEASDAPEIVLSRALGRLGEIDYCLFENNCEHFAVWCKTGWPHSTQVAAHHDAGRAIVRGAPFGMSVLRVAGRVPVPYRGWAYAAAIAAAGTVYAGTYLAQRHADKVGQRS